MAVGAQLVIALAADRGGPFGTLLSWLKPGERVASRAQPTRRRRRQFALGRLAARAALASEAEIEAGPGGAPCVLGTGRVSIAHSGRLAVAAAWRASACRRFGVDLEKVRASEVGVSEYAFSRSERNLIASAGRSSGLSAWVAKEAAWKAMRLPPSAGPQAARIRARDLRRGSAVVHARSGERTVRFRVSLRRIAGPDGTYLLALAEERR